MIFTSRNIKVALLTTTLLTGSLQASSSQEGSTLRIGVGVAAEYLTTTWKHKTDSSDVVRRITGSASESKKSGTVAPSFEIGTYINDQFYLGFFTSWRYINATAKSHQPLSGYHDLQHLFKISHAANALFKCGYKTSQQALLYLKFGPTYTRWSHRTTLTRRGVDLDNMHSNKNSLGLAFGGGVEFPIFHKTTLSLDYTHNFYKSSKIQKSMTVAQPFLGNVTGNISETVNLSQGVFAVRMSYFF